MVKLDSRVGGYSTLLRLLGKYLALYVPSFYSLRIVISIFYLVLFRMWIVNTYVCLSNRSGMAVIVCKYIFGAFDDIEDVEAEGKIFEKESRAAQAVETAPRLE